MIVACGTWHYRQLPWHAWVVTMAIAKRQHSISKICPYSLTPEPTEPIEEITMCLPARGIPPLARSDVPENGFTTS